MIKKALAEFASQNGLKLDRSGKDTVAGVYGSYKRLNVSVTEGARGSVFTVHNRVDGMIDGLRRDLTAYGLVDGVEVREGKVTFTVLDDKYALSETDYAWALDAVITFAERFKYRVGNCESCGSGGAEFYKNTKTGKYYCICPTCKSNFRSAFNRREGEKTGFWARIKRFFRGNKADRELVKLP
jgi:hypothetical protein